MFKTCITRAALLICSLLTFMHISVPLAHAATTGLQVTITQPTGLTGHPGTKVEILGRGFNPYSSVTLQLYTTTSTDPTNCAPGNANLNRFAPVVTQGATFTFDSIWPDNAATVGSAYYICVIGPSSITVLSDNAFTVAPPATMNISPPSVAAGQQVTISGTNWLPPQSLTVAIAPPQGAVIASKSVTSDTNGNFSVTLTIPADTLMHRYSVSVTADNEPTLKQKSAITVIDTTTPTPTPAPSPTAVPTTGPSGTPTSTTQTGTTANGADTAGGGNSFFLFILAGLGVLFVIVGIFLFVMYSRGRQA